MKNTFSETELVIGANFLNHDSAIFAIDVRNHRAFGMSTERITRYKHDALPPVPVIQELIRELEIDPAAVRRVVIATSLETQLQSRVECELYTEMASLREVLRVKYLKDVVRECERYSHLPRSSRWKLLLSSSAGHRYLLHKIRTNGKTTSFESMVASEVKCFFPKAKIEVCAFDHHLAHAIGAYFLSGFTDPLSVTLDGWGDGAFSKVFVGGGSDLKEVSVSKSISVGRREERLRLNGQVAPHILATGIFDHLSLGHFYSIITWLLGFEPLSDEGKVEALAAYGTPDNDFLAELRKTVTLDQDNVSLMVSECDALALYFDIPRLQGYVLRLGKEKIAAAAQRFLEECSLDLISCALKRWPRSSIVLSGGCAANVILNMHIFERICENLYIIPAMGDDGIALGSCLLALMESGVSERDLAFLQDRQVPYFGNQHPRSASQNCLAKFGQDVAASDRSADWPEAVAALLFEGKVGAIYHGPMEWGPRALGNRSILADPRDANMRERINSVVKKRPLFQPFCPSVLLEEKDRLFERAYPNRHMTCAFRMRKEFWTELPSAIHIDGTARVQFVSADDNPLFYRVLAEFKRLSGFGVLINTSFNMHGRTIVNTPEDAMDDFLDSKMDFLVLDGYLVLRPESVEPKTRQKRQRRPHNAAAYALPHR
jgi:carbamoyltransferase